VIANSTVKETAIVRLTGNKLLECWEHLVKLAAEAGLTVRQNYIETRQRWPFN
jgi:hypothetical protein